MADLALVLLVLGLCFLAASLALWVFRRIRYSRRMRGPVPRDGKPLSDDERYGFALAEFAWRDYYGTDELRWAERELEDELKETGAGQ